MKKKKMNEKRSKAKEGLNRKLINYSIVAGAALAVAHPASAAVQYSGLQNITVSDGPAFIDLDGGGQDDFVFANYHKHTVGTNIYGINLMFPYYYGNAFVSTKTYFQTTTPGGSMMTYSIPVPQRMAASQTAGPVASWTSFFYGFLGDDGFFLGQPIGQFVGEEGYIGVRFNIGGPPGATHYGWIRFRGAADYSSGTIIDWAYEDVADTPIHLQAPDPASIPTLNEWGIIILMGLILMEGTRRLKKKKEE